MLGQVPPPPDVQGGAHLCDLRGVVQLSNSFNRKTNSSETAQFRLTFPYFVQLTNGANNREKAQLEFLF